MDDKFFYTLLILNFIIALGCSIVMIMQKGYGDKRNHPYLIFVISNAILFGYRLAFRHLDVPQIRHSNLELTFIFHAFSASYLYYIAYFCFLKDKFKRYFFSGFITSAVWILTYLLVLRFGGSGEFFTTGTNAFAESPVVIFDLKNALFLLLKLIHPILIVFIVFKQKRSGFIKIFSLVCLGVITTYILRNYCGSEYSVLFYLCYIENLLILGWLTYRHIFHVAWVKNAAVASSSTVIESLDGPNAKYYTMWLNIQEYMHADNPWLDPDLSTEAIAKHLNIDKDEVLSTISKHGHSNIYNFIASYRINEFCKQIKKDYDVDIIELFTKVGFRSSSSAYRQFRRIKGLTPKRYIELERKK